MVNKVRTIDFLPDIFQTDYNRQFLNATLDVLVAQPELQRVQGFVGNKYGYGISPTDKYVVEPTRERSDYQLDPSVVFLKPDTQTADDFISYPGILNALKNYGSNVSNHDRLFNNQFYSWDPFVDYDKIVNYSQYYWIPFGPDAVLVSNNTVYNTQNYIVTKTTDGSYTFSTVDGTNPAISLLRGGIYTFTVDQDSDFWLQGVTTLDGIQPNTTINTREILGVTNNGTSDGTITFAVPLSTAQDAYNFPGNLQVDLLTTLDYADINGQSITDIDGITSLNGKTLLFYDNGVSATQTNFYTISVSGGTVTLTLGAAIPNNTKITVNLGNTYKGQTFYRSAGTINQIPYLSSQLDRIYYRDGTIADTIGTIDILESNSSAKIDITDIIGHKNYTSPNGVTFTNGLKVTFDSTVVPITYANKEYYVSGVGTAIELLPVTNFVCPEASSEPIYNPWDMYPWDTDTWDVSLYNSINPDYITIDRSARNQNAWSRANRWFHQSVIDTTVAQLGQVTINNNNNPTRAQRPILEFRPELQLFDSGNNSAGSVLLFDTVTTDALGTVNGQSTYTIDGATLPDGCRVIFSNDDSYSVRQTVYIVDYVDTTGSGNFVISLTPDTTTPVIDNTQIVVLSGNTLDGTSWYFDADNSTWTRAQQKSTLNQAPLYDMFDSSGNSYSNTDYYPATTFVGTKLFSYTPGTGANDPVLGFPIKYSSVTNIGDINFTVNLNTDTFNYYTGSSTLTQQINTGYVHEYTTPSTTVYSEKTGWVTAAAESVQYQVFEFTVQEITNSFSCDIPALSQEMTIWDPVQIYFNDNILTKDQYSYIVDNTSETTVVTTVNAANVGDKITVLILSDKVSNNAYYSIPSNLQNNPFNTNVTSVDVGDIRTQYRTIFSNAPGVTGVLFGTNNIHDLPNYNNYGTSIIQNSGSLVLPGVFLRKGQVDFFRALQFNNQEYFTYKSLIVDLAANGDYSIYQTPAYILDDIIQDIVSIKQNNTSFFWSDMLFSGSPYKTSTYTVFPSQVFTLYQTYDFSSANYKGLALYLTKTVGYNTTVTQLIRNRDYVLNSAGNEVTVTVPLVPGDSLEIVEYNQTYGSYCPNTPSKLGLYPAFIPQVVYDTSYSIPTWFIRGHDGSMTKLYGPYQNNQLTDFRDIALLEFETRIYNNIKVKQDIPLVWADVNPGQFRTTEYSYQEILDIYATNFLNWVGANRLDYQTQVFNIANRYSYNYSQTSNKLDKEQFQQGYWRGIYRWMYDTDNPALAPWELLGFADKPDWWETRYGPAPYTSSNTYMWDEISDGFVWNAGSPYINQRYIRPRLSQALAVDQIGNLVAPYTAVVGGYASGAGSSAWTRDWKVGDGAPVETAYIKSSTWPFDLVRILALTKPAKFFNLFADLDRYRYNSDFDQYLYDYRYHLDPTQLQIYGDGTAKHSYINWIVDYVNNRGVDGTNAVKTLLENLDVRLCYRLAGFSSKDYLRFYVERATPNSKNTSFLIPDQSYGVLLYDNVPEKQITYSSVIFQRLQNGWMLLGNSLSTNYFTIARPKTNGINCTITVNNVTVTVSNDFYTDQTITVPYGTMFYSYESIAEFLKAYGFYQETCGVVFNNIYDGIEYNWNRMIEEFIGWAQDNWELGSTIALNPSSKNFVVNNPNLIVQPLTIQDKNFVLNQNLLPIQAQNSSIIRNNTEFTVKILNDGDTVSYTNLNLYSMEHATVFDNTTIFGDVIYNLVTGLRQNRLLLKGSKTANWHGYIDSNGFILSQDNIVSWNSNQKYAKGKVVTYKDKYWIANQLIEPSATFDQTLWTQIDSDQIQLGMLPNPSTESVESLYYYDSNKANLNIDADLLGFSLIGYRPRDYMAAADLSDITQVNVFKTFIPEKGTLNAIQAFKNTEFDQGPLDYEIYENWAVNTASFGAVLNSNYVEARLNESRLSANPSTVGFAQSGTVAGVEQTVLLSELVNYERKPTSANFLPKYSSNYTEQSGLPSAGYVNLDDVTATLFAPEELNSDPLYLNDIFVGDTIWIANYLNSWGIFTPISLETQLVTVINNQNGTCTFRFAANHGLKELDIFQVQDFDDRVNYFYAVSQVVDTNTVLVDFTLPSDINVIEGTGTAAVLVSRRYEQASDYSTLPYSQFRQQQIWVDSDTDDNWAVWSVAPRWRNQNYIYASGLQTGYSVAHTTALGTIYSNPTINTVYIYRNGSEQTPLTGSNSFGTVVVAKNDRLWVSNNNTVYCYRLISNTMTLTATVSTAVSINDLAVSQDGRWMYVASSSANSVLVYRINSAGTAYTLVNTINGTAGTQFGYSIATSIDGLKLVVGAPQETVDAIVSAGAAYFYSRDYQRFVSNGTTTTYTVYSTVLNEIVDVYVNDVLQPTSSYTLTGDTVVFGSAPTVGSIITIEWGNFTLTQRTVSQNPRSGARFGNSLDTNRYGAEILVGCPQEVNNVSSVITSEGAVYRYTNSGQRYGVISSENPSVSVGTKIYIDGYQVEFFTATTNVNDIATVINIQTPTNIIASAVGTTLIISVLDNTAELPFNIIDLVASVSALDALNVQTHQQTQVIRSVDNQRHSKFGYTVTMNERDSVIISATTANRLSPTTFDYSDDSEHNDTIYDMGTTIFVDEFANQGQVYLYDYLPAYSENISNPGQYAFGQYLSEPGSSQTVNNTYGNSSAYQDGVIVVGAPNYTSTTGTVSIYRMSLAQDAGATSSWTRKYSPLPMVDINRINNISIYDSLNNQTLDFLDYIDPVQGKLLGAVATNIDYITSSDPAGYPGGKQTWGPEQVGKTWLDTQTIRMLNYNQSSVEYNAKNWGKAFPGSTADIYTWIESDVEPINYDGLGFPPVFDRFCQTIVQSDSADTLVFKYYFWVKNYDAVPPGKSLSPTVLSQYLLDPHGSGISFLAPISTNIVALHNCSQSINDTTSILHIGYGNDILEDQKHTEWQLFGANNPQSFLTGFPTTQSESPSGLYLKYLDSFAGEDTLGLPVPDPTLPLQLRSGVSVVPRQSMFMNRTLALTNYTDYCNDVLSQYPITELYPTSDIGSYVNISWAYTDYYSSGYSSSTKPALEVNQQSDLQAITTQVLLSGNTFLRAGLVAKVKSNSDGRWELYVYNSNGSWDRIAVQNGTIKLLSTVDPDAIRQTIRWINEVVFTGQLEHYRNGSLMLMFNYISSETNEQRNYIKWLMKTSLIDVNHKIRDLLPYKKYQRDNQEFLSGYLNEVKPYHVYIKNFVYTYSGNDVYQAYVSDFDLPARYNNGASKFISPQLVYDESQAIVTGNYLPEDDIWKENDYQSWFNNYGLSYENPTNKEISITQLAQSISNVDIAIPVKSFFGLQPVGIIRIGSEYIRYSGITRSTGTLNNCIRGFNGTISESHDTNDLVFVEQSPVIVLDTGRGYTESPQITANVNSTVYPNPRESAQFTPNIVDDQLLSVIIDSTGSGYSVSPLITVESSSIQHDFVSANINSTTNSITIVGHQFETGDSVVFSKTGNVDYGLTVGSYYYVRSISNNEIALYNSYYDCANVGTDLEKVATLDTARVKLFTDTTTGSGKLSVTARLQQNLTSYPTRMLNVTMAFDRCSYTSNVGAWDTDPWDSGSWDSLDDFTAATRIELLYNPTADMPGKNLEQLMSGVVSPYGALQGLSFTSTEPLDSIITGPSFTSTANTTYEYQGVSFNSGYAPEELVAGVVYDNLAITTKTNPDNGILDFRINVSRSGYQTVYNTNPFTQTAMAQNFVTTDSETDTIYVDDIDALTTNNTTTVTLDSNGEAILRRVEISTLSGIYLSVSDPFTFRYDGFRVVITVPTRANSTIDVTVYQGNMIYVNQEYIRFDWVNPSSNSITRLHRGMAGTITNETISSGTVVQGVLDRDKLKEIWTDYWWYDGADQLVVDASTPAQFLQRTSL